MNNRERKAAARAASPGRAKSPGRARPAPDAQPLNKKRRRRLAEQAASDDEADDDGAMMPAAMQRKVMLQARLQQDEMDGEAAAADSGTARYRAPGRPSVSKVPDVRHGALDDDEDDDDVNEAAYDEEADAAELAEAGEFYDVDELELGEEDERALDLLMGGGAPQRTLADVIMEKINERNAALAGDGHAGEGAGDADLAGELPPKVIEVYTSVGKLLSTCESRPASPDCGCTLHVLMSEAFLVCVPHALRSIW